MFVVFCLFWILPIMQMIADSHHVQVTVTPNHRMMVQGKGAIDAADVEVGDVMWIHQDSHHAASTMTPTAISGSVTAVDPVRDAQPVRLVLTQSGTIVVNGVVASSLESSGSSMVKHLLDVGQAVGGQAGAQVARSFTYAVGSLVTGGDAQQTKAVS